MTKSFLRLFAFLLFMVGLAFVYVVYKLITLGWAGNVTIPTLFITVLIVCVYVFAYWQVIKLYLHLKKESK